MPRTEQVEAQLERLLSRQTALQEERERLQRVVAAERKHPRRDWTGAFEWDARVQRLLGDVFGLRAFRPLQVQPGCCAVGWLLLQAVREHACAVAFSPPRRWLPPLTAAASRLTLPLALSLPPAQPARGDQCHAAGAGAGWVLSGC